MAEEPELTSTTKQRIINPLLMAWAFVLIMLSLTVSWVYLSDDPPIENIPAAVLEQTDEPENIDNNVVENTDPVPSINMEPEKQEDITAALTQAEPIVPQSVADKMPVTLMTPDPLVTNEEDRLTASQTALKTAPNENLLIRGANGLKPVIGPDGLIAWQEYARNYDVDDNSPRIAILITDIGLNTRSSDRAINDLPGQIDLAFSPYGRNLQRWMDKARAKGHEGFLMIPTEPLNYPANDPGPHTLISDLSEQDNLLRLDWVLSQVTGYVGVVNHMGSKFTASEVALTPILNDLKNRGLMFLDARSTRFSMAARMARGINMPVAMNDRYIDNIIAAKDIQMQLGELEKTATTFGAAVGLARATPLTITEISKWAMSLKEKGIELVPVSAIANRQPIK